MRDQLQRLIRLSETNQVMPFAAAVHPTMDGGFTILSFSQAARSRHRVR
ncbi:Scr1 family TA system antitoxin-like transcriptional regulator [Streptosporangium sp. NBC_01756]